VSEKCVRSIEAATAPLKARIAELEVERNVIAEALHKSGGIGALPCEGDFVEYALDRAVLRKRIEELKWVLDAIRATEPKLIEDLKGVMEGRDDDWTGDY